MDIGAFTESFTQVEVASLVLVAIVVAALLGPGAITVDGSETIWIEILSAALMGLLAFVVGALSLWASKQ